MKESKEIIYFSDNLRKYKVEKKEKKNTFESAVELQRIKRS